MGDSSYRDTPILYTNWCIVATMRTYREYRFLWLRRLLLWLALGPKQYRYMKRILAEDPRATRAYMTDIVIRKDGVERRFEADWVRSLARILHPPREDWLGPIPSPRPLNSNIPAMRGKRA